ncbi:MAG: GGDEF domain-containing protein [Xanthomonadales bacterium]|nr:GGDEF domain-containing protein [Xanthomonadales bacterium]
MTGEFMIDQQTPTAPNDRQYRTRSAFDARLLPAIAALLLVLSALPIATAYSRQLATPTAGHDTALIEPLRLLHERGARLTLDEARSELAEGRFERNDHPAGNYGFRPEGMWFHLRLRNPGIEDPNWLLMVNYPLIDYLEVYIITADGNVSHRRSGDRVAFAERAIPMREPNFALSLPPGEVVEVFLRAESQSSMQVPLVVAPAADFLADRIPGNQALGMYYGVLAALGLYNLILHLSVRDRIFLWYVVYLVSFGILVAVLNGLAFQYLWPAFPDFGNRFLIVSIPLALMAMLQFSRRFLETDRHAPRLHRLINWTMLALLAESIAALFLSYRTCVLVETASVFIVTPLVLLAAFRVLPRYRPARYFLLAWSTLLISLIVYSAVSFGYLPKQPLTEYSVQIGSALEMVLLSFALAYRFNLLKAENERIQSDAREQLESRVRARTYELDATLKRLEDANRRLEDFSRRDGLTNVYNRRHLDHLLQQALTDAHDHAHPLALMLLDVDHFKQINDRHGHLAGDDCLRAVARCCREMLSGSEGTVARYGGEEFVVLLPSTGLDAAQRLAEALRERIERLLINVDGRTIPLTISIGLHCAAANALPLSGKDLIAAADEALYRAKQDGRNRVQLCAASATGS